MPINSSPFQLALCKHLDKGSRGDPVAGNIISPCSSEKSSEDDRYWDENKRRADRRKDALEETAKKNESPWKKNQVAEEKRCVGFVVGLECGSE